MNDLPSQSNRRAPLMSGLLVVVANIVGFGWTARMMVTGETAEFDRRLLISLREPGNHSVPVGADWLRDAIRDITSLGGFAVLILLTVGLVGFFLLNRNRLAARFVSISIVGGFLVSVTLKSAFSRPRPDIVPHLSGSSMSSFPSAHAMMSAIVYFTIATLMARSVERRIHKVSFFLLAVLLTLVIGGSRVYLGVHYPTDVFAGWCAGVAWATLTGLAAYRFDVAFRNHELDAERP